MRKMSIFLFIILFVLLIVFFLRLILPSQLDDVSPLIPCDKSLLKKASVFYVIPKFNGVPISQNKSWCRYILSFNKTIALHGYEHKYRELEKNFTKETLNESMRIFYNCFGFYPKYFKPPQLKISKENKKLIKSRLNLDGIPNQMFHKVYHCNDSGVWPNKFISIF